MGLCASQEEKAEAAKTKEIDKQISADKSENNKTIKLLLLGAGECGKSTILKQMRLHHKKYSEEELAQQKTVVFNNTINAMVEICRFMAENNFQFEKEERKQDLDVLKEVLKKGKESEPFDKPTALALHALWADPIVKDFYKQHKLIYHLHESTQYFMDRLDRICQPDFTPNSEEILYTRIKTTGIVEVNFEIDKANFRVFDVGGQRSERKKWIHCFEDVNAIIFIVAISEYDEVLAEDQHTNRLVESIRLYEQITNSRWFVKTSMIIFLNKTDLFREKISTSKATIAIAFPNYDGPHEVDASVDFIKAELVKKQHGTKERQKQVYFHLTCATDTNQVAQILQSVIATIIRANLYKTGLY
ncbi:hypothetical protein PFISCL1PPCAC_1683 [Pristionchus fissidentatus]|uniref:ADP ribosylation factor n=1 Tax=Pristionchus fissidentatus TaxID=1538716 RepID=A0AAV5UV55_9BILA|nr:hypothetical protein PFISCL1PPCAC_1683 [Pristionchus fissidentatus]